MNERRMRTGAVVNAGAQNQMLDLGLSHKLHLGFQLPAQKSMKSTCLSPPASA